MHYTLHNVIRTYSRARTYTYVCLVRNNKRAELRQSEYASTYQIIEHLHDVSLNLDHKTCIPKTKFITIKPIGFIVSIPKVYDVND